MKIQPIKRFILEEFPKDIRSWLDKIFQPLNTFMEQSVALSNNGITIADNLKAQTFEVTVYGNGFPAKRSWRLNQKPIAVWEVAISEEEAGTGTIPPHSLIWSFKGDSVEFTVNGLNAGTKYRITFIGLC